jgi:hypothetical protein
MPQRPLPFALRREDRIGKGRCWTKETEKLCPPGRLSTYSEVLSGGRSLINLDAYVEQMTMLRRLSLLHAITHMYARCQSGVLLDVTKHPARLGRPKLQAHKAMQMLDQIQ